MQEQLTLDGTWQVLFDDDNQGRVLNWQKQENFANHAEIEQITVPASLEEFQQDYEGVAWYGKTFIRPANWHNKTIRLHFEAVNYRAEIWINNQAAGAHEGGYTGFELLIDDLLTDGENFIAVRVITPLIRRHITIDGLGRDDMPHWRGAITGGIWQPVYLIATGHVFIDDTFVTPDIHTGEIIIANTWQNQQTKIQDVKSTWTLTKYNDNTPLVCRQEQLRLNPGTTHYQTSIAIKDHKLWHLDTPHLYVLTTTLRLDAVDSDQTETRFGFREFTARGKNFYLNGEKIILKTTFNEAFYPHSLAYPRDLELLQREFQLIKDGNINMIRPWRKPQPKIVYDLADELGVLFVGTLPVECMQHWPQLTPYTQQRIENETTEMVKRDRNHPSIVIWEMFNEIGRHGLKRLKHSISLKARALDHSRMIIDEAGGFADGCSVYLPGSYEPITINDVHNYPGVPMAQESYDRFLALGKNAEQLKHLDKPIKPFANSNIKPGLLTNISELGYGSIPDLEANLAQYKKEGNPITPDYRMHQRLHDSYLAVFYATGTDQVFVNFHAFVKACQKIHYTGNKLMAEACRINPDIAGIGIHALNDGDWVLGAGLIDNFRNPKKPYYAIKEVFAERYIAIRPSTQNLYAGQTVQILLTAVNDKDAVSGTLSVRLKTDAGQILLDVHNTVTLPHGITDLTKYEVNTNGVEGRCHIELRFNSGNGLGLQNKSSIYVLDKKKSRLPDGLFALIDINGKLQKSLANTIDFTASTATDKPVLVNLNGWDGTPDIRFQQLATWVEHGGTAVFLNLPPVSVLKPSTSGNRMYRLVEKNTILPFSLSLYSGKGLWTPCSHVVKDHPFYHGLPANCLMGQEYRNVVSQWSIVQPECHWLGGNITYDWHAGLQHKQNYIGVNEAFHAAELTPISHGNGTYILCTHRLVENLGTDPLADRLLSNILRTLMP